MDSFQAGYAEVGFTPDPGQPLQGQQFARVGNYVRDPLMAVAAAYAQGGESLVIVATDMCFFPTDLATRTQQEFDKRTGVAAERLLIHATHSHVAPHSIADIWGEPDPQFLDRLSAAVVDAANQALKRLQPVELFAGSTCLECLGWNRRAMFSDGTSQMHGKACRDDFEGSEGPRDGTLSVLFTRTATGDISGAVVNFANHPNSVECENYYSADIPGEIRRLLKLWLGGVAVLYLTGAAGNVTPLILEPYTPRQPWMGEDGLARSGMYLASGAAQAMAAAAEPMDAPELHVRHEALQIPVRPYPPSGHVNYPRDLDDEAQKHYAKQIEVWPRVMREESPVEVRLNVARIGGAVICTNPAELFVEHGLSIRSASPAVVTIISELTDGYVGYVPTRLAFSRGGYETWPAYTSKLDESAGEQIVESTAHLMEQVFRD